MKTLISCLALAALLTGGHVEAVTITQLTFGPASDTAPSWSPDGTRIAFSSDRSGNEDIWIIDAGGSDPIQLTTHPGFDNAPSWSPDGAWIVFTSNRTGGGEELWRIPSAGGDPVRVTDTARRELEPTWAPAGDWVVCHASYSSWEIVIYDAFTGALVSRVTDHPAADFEPGFAPMLDLVVFRSDRGGNPDIFLAPIPAGPEATQITTHPGIDLQPHMSAAHGLITFSSDRGGPGGITLPPGPWTDDPMTRLPVDVWITDAAGVSYERVTDDALANHQPVWSPDGQRIAFQSLRSGNWDVFIADDLPLATAVEGASWGAIKAGFVRE